MVNNIEQSHSGMCTFVPPEDLDKIDVIGRVNDLEPWFKLSNVIFGEKIKTQKKGWIVTASMTQKRFLEVSKMPFVSNLEESPRLRFF